MSDVATSQEPRRSQRDKKQSTHFVSVDSTLIKRKRSDATTDDDNDEQSGLSEPESRDEDGEAEDGDGEATTPKPKAASKTRRKAKGPPPQKKPRATKDAAAPKARKTAAKSSAPKATKPRKAATRKGKQAAIDASDFDAEKVAKDSKIAGDNALFNAIMNPAAALQSTADDFLQSLSQTPGPSHADLVNCILRTCGCNDTVNEDQAVDYDGVVDTLDDFTEGLKQDDSPVYPLTSKLLVFKKFRKSLSEFIERLISAAAAYGSLYTSDLMATLLSWVVAMSSSQLRSFRHTATVIALEVETALCDVAAAVEKEAEVISRQREGERKRKGAGNKGKAGSALEKDLEHKAAEVRERRTGLAEYLKELFDGVFVHRYRDLDPNIRAECVRAMGQWFTKHPGHFLDGSYLRYVGWVLSDAHTTVRLEAVRALARAYEQGEHAGAAALQNFTERFKPRLVEMAAGDTELAVRVAVVQVLQAIDGHGLLEDEQRERLCLLVFDEEARVRKAVSAFVRGVWEETVEERMVGQRATAKDKKRAGVKALGMLLVNWGKALDKTEEDSDLEDDEGEAGPSSRGRGKEVASLVAQGQKGRTALAVDALWGEIEPVRNWEILLEVLLLDHSAAGEEDFSQGRGKKGKGKKVSTDPDVDEAWRLEEAEEAMLLEMLVAVLRKAKADVAGAKKGEDETVASDITRALIEGLPRLFVKHQTDEKRLADVLLIPQLMSLDLYLEMRLMTAYSNLWEDVTKQFLSHSSPLVLSNAVAAIRQMMDATSLSKTNSTKILELEDELSTSLRDAIAGRDEIEIASFSEDEVLSLGAICARLAALIGIRDMTSWMEEDEGGKQSSAWDIVSALAERGRLGYRGEEQMVDRALHVLTLHIMWKARGLHGTDVEASPEDARFLEKLKEQRESLLEKLLEFAVGTRSNTIEGVRRAGFQNLMNLHILFCPAQSIAPDGSKLPTAAVPLSLDDEAQYRCAGFVQAEIERYVEELDETPASHDESDEDDDDSGGTQSEGEGRDKPKKSNATKHKKSAKQLSTGDATTSRSKLEKEYVFLGIIATFLRAIRAGVIDFKHSATLLAHHGRLGPAFDLCSKVVVDVLREEGMYKDHGDAVVEVICQALRESFSLFVDNVVQTEEHAIALAKSLAPCLLIRGAQLSVVRRLDSKFVVAIHTSCLTWIGTRLAVEKAQNKKTRKGIQFFRVLLPLLASVDSRDALSIKAHVDQTLAQAKLEVSATGRLWEPCRAYEKRLTNATTKEKAAGAKGKKNSRKSAKSADLVGTTDDEGDDLMGGPAVPQRQTRRATRAAREVESGTDVESGATDDDENPFGDTMAPDPVTPKRRPQPQATYRSARRATRSSSSPPEASVDELPGTPDPLTTPSVSRKRPHSDDEEPEEYAANMESPHGDAASAMGSPSAEPPASQTTQAGEFQVRRKRIRH